MIYRDTSMLPFKRDCSVYYVETDTFMIIVYFLDIKMYKTDFRYVIITSKLNTFKVYQVYFNSLKCYSCSEATIVHASL